MFGVTVDAIDVLYNSPMNEVAPAVTVGLLRVDRIHQESAVHEYTREREIADRFPAAKLIEVSARTGTH